MSEPAVIETLIEEMMRDWSMLSAERDGLDLAAAHLRLAYGAGYTRGLEERQCDQRPS